MPSMTPVPTGLRGLIIDCPDLHLPFCKETLHIAPATEPTPQDKCPPSKAGPAGEGHEEAFLIA